MYSNMKRTCIIVDDEPLALALLEEYVKRTPELELRARCVNGTEALEVLGRERIDVAFLDIQMPGLSGLEVAHKVDGATKIIFTTAFEQFALEGFRADAVDYLLKPINYEEFRHAVDKVLSWFATSEEQSAPSPRTLIVKADYKQHVVPFEDIVFVKGEKDYVRIRTAEGELKSLMSMRSVEESLPSEMFQRVHRSYIVNLDKVKTIGRQQVVVESDAIPVSDSYKEELMRRLSNR